MDEVKCPNCRSISFVRKGKSKDGQFQRLRCKKCLRNWSVESFLVNRQIELPEISFAIVEHPNKMFSINKIQTTKKENKQFIENLDFITSKVSNYQEVVELASKLNLDIHPNPVQLDIHVPETLRKQLTILFPPDVTKQLIKFMETLCKGLSWSN